MLELSTRKPDSVVAVDTGSSDRSLDLLTAALGDAAVVAAPPVTGFGDAVRRGLQAVDGQAVDGATVGGKGAPNPAAEEWVWLLHDDCAPAPDTLQRLVSSVTADPTIDVIGCRVRAWPRGRRLLEVGVTITGTGRRETGLEPGEYDQGQHEGERQVLAVSSAGMLVRRATWELLGGFDARLPLFRDDVDFGWRVARSGGRLVVSPDAVLFHAEASARGQRAIANTSASPHLADRRAAIYAVLVNSSPWLLPWQYLRLTGGSVLRALGYLLGTLPSAAMDELRAMCAVLVRPDTVIAARWARRPTARVGWSRVRRLLPPWWTPYLHGADSLGSFLADRVRGSAVTGSAAQRQPRPGETRARPLVSLLAVSTVLAVVASRGLWTGAGQLSGGALLPAPGGAGNWWRLYFESWHPVGLGTSQPASPYVAMLGLLSALLLGKAWLVVQLLMLLAVPLAGWGALAAARRLVTGWGTRWWMASAYALVPVLTGSVTSGRVGTVVATITLPWLVCTTLTVFDRSTASPWRAVFTGSLLLAVMVAFCPLAWAMAAATAVAGLPWLLRRRPRLVGPVAFLVASPVALLAPWSFDLLSQPRKLLHEAGGLDPIITPLGDHAWQLPFGRLVAAGEAPWWISVGVVVAGALAILRADRRTEVAAAWLLVAVGVVAAAVVSRQVVVSPTGEQSYAWAGFAVVVAQGAVIAAAGKAADGLTAHVRAGAFGWRQPIGVLAVILAISTPVAGALWWVVTAPEGQLSRVVATDLPAYLIDTTRSPTQQRVLVLGGDHLDVTYDVWLDDGRRLGDDSVDAAPGSAALDDLVARLLSDARPSDVARLADFGIGYVVLPVPVDPGLEAELDGLGGLSRASSDVTRSLAWQLDAPTGLARLLSSDRPGAAGHAEVVGSHSGEVDVDIGPGGTARIIRLAAGNGEGDEEFSASLDGTKLVGTDTSVGLGFAVGPDPGRLTVSSGGQRGWWLLAQLGVLVVVLVLATPSLRPREGITTGSR